MILVLGTPGSGKSALAEELVLELAGTSRKYYIATLVPFGEEGQARVARHRLLRKDKGFVTIECPRVLGSILNDIKPGSAALLECMSNLLGNELYAPENCGKSDSELVELLLGEVTALDSCCESLVVVSNGFEAAPGYDSDTLRYIHLAELVNDGLKQFAERIYDHSSGEWIYYDNN